LAKLAYATAMDDDLLPAQTFAAVLSEVTQALLPARVLGIITMTDTDQDGDGIVRIRVLFDHSGPAPEGKKMLDAPVRVRSILRELGEYRFPHVTFVSDDEAQEDAA
jgi:hypothetical protein